MTKLTAENLKGVLWDTLNGVKGGTVDPKRADAVATQAREIMRTTKTQIQIAQHAKRELPKGVIEFSEK